MEIRKKIDGFLHSFDKFAEPVANLNMNGKSHYKTRLGGFCGLTVFGLIASFIVVRGQKMINRVEPIIYEVTQGMNLMSKDTPQFQLSEQSFNFGIGAYGKIHEWEWNEETGTLVGHV